MSNDHACIHIKVTGVRCNSPALRGEQFCYFHQNAHRGVRRPPQSRLHPIAMIEDEESIHVGTAAIGCPAQAKASASVGTDAFVRPASAASVPTPAATTAKVTSCPAPIPRTISKPRSPRRNKPHPLNRTQHPNKLRPTASRPRRQNQLRRSARMKPPAQAEDELRNETSAEGANENCVCTSSATVVLTFPAGAP
jgi:hypothetical protein